jgi:hypothetical protein
MEFRRNLHARGGGCQFTEESSRHLSFIIGHILALALMQYSVNKLEKIVTLEANICLMLGK